jgi:HEAT repeat protein
MQPINSQDGIQTATAVFHSLVSKRVADRNKAAEYLESPFVVDLPTLRTLLTKAITQDYYVGKEDEQDDEEISSTRSWLLEVLARISAGDEEATKLVMKHIDSKVEHDPWIRYWALEGLIIGKNSQAETAARNAANDKDLLVALLATAFLASLKDPEAVKKIREGLDNLPDALWYILRALRIVPLPFAVQKLCKIVEKAEYSDATYDAIVALGNVPGNWNHSLMATQSLSACIIKMRGSPWQDGMRTGAISGLGNLKAESSALLILEELADDNPAVVREAARALQKILGLNATVVRIVETASKDGVSAIETYARALRWLNRDAVAEELETLMTTGAARQQEVARTLLSELGGTVAFEKLRARTDVMKQYADLLEQTDSKVQQLFEVSVHDAQRGFNLAVGMDVTVFVLGVVLLFASAGYALFNSGNLSSWAGVGISGGVGVLGIVYGVLVANPRRQVRESVDHLMEMKILFLAYLRRLHQADQAYTRLLLDDEPISTEQVKLFADIVGNIMRDTLQGRSNDNGMPSETQGSKNPEG